MSVSTTAVLALFVVLALLPLTHPARAATSHGRVLILHATQLERETKLYPLQSSYKALASGSVLYQQCGTELEITDEQQDYLRQKFIDVSRQYQRKFQDIYTDKVGIPPGQVFMNDVSRLMQQQQQDAVDRSALVVARRGCKFGLLRPTLDYIDTLRIQDSKPAEEVIIPPTSEVASPVEVVPETPDK